MTPTPARSAVHSSTDILHRGDAAAGPFMLTLCRLVEPVSIRPPQSPQLRPFTFFTSRARSQDGSEERYLHMGFFETLDYAERWARAVRGRHPDAIAAVTPPAFWQSPDSDPSLSRLDNGQTMTDTQVLNILEMRGPASTRIDGESRRSAEIELLRPDDTGTRLALKEAVIQGAPVSFAVQLAWSAQPIDPSHVPMIPILKGYTRYVVESRRANRSSFFLRLGFFADPVSAKEIALVARSRFAAAAVIPVLGEEMARAREAFLQNSSSPCLVQQRLDQTIYFNVTPEPERPAAPKPESGRRRSVSPGHRTMGQTLAELAEREMWNDPDALSDTGVRHLKVEVKGRAGSRSRH